MLHRRVCLLLSSVSTKPTQCDLCQCKALPKRDYRSEISRVCCACGGRFMHIEGLLFLVRFQLGVPS